MQAVARGAPREGSQGSLSLEQSLSVSCPLHAGPWGISQARKRLSISFITRNKIEMSIWKTL